MPVHDWTRVEAGTFHHFHNAWIIHLAEAMNAGLLPAGYYAMGEQVASKWLPDILTLKGAFPNGKDQPSEGGIATIEAAPRVQQRLRPNPKPGFQRKPRSVVIRHTSGHQVVAFIEIASPANKDRPTSVEDLVVKVTRALDSRVSVLLIDLLPPSNHDPRGIHGAIWECYGDAEYLVPSEKTLTVASYTWDALGPEAYVEPVSVGMPLTDMPLFLRSERYVILHAVTNERSFRDRRVSEGVWDAPSLTRRARKTPRVGHTLNLDRVWYNLPLESTYMEAYRGMPEFWRDVIEGKMPPLSEGVSV